MKVTFVGMSGVRIYDPELSALGMTLPGFLERGKVIASLPSLGLLTLASLTPSEVEVAYLEVESADSAAHEAVLATSPDLVAVSSLTAKIDDAYSLCDDLREHGVPVVIGGLHATALPDEAAGHADSVVTGEGDLVWPHVVADFLSHGPRPRYDSGGRSLNLWRDGWPVPRYDLLDAERYNRFTVQTTRGCPLDCEFCGASRMLGPYRRKPLDQIERELAAVNTVCRHPFVELADDNTFIDKRWGRELVRRLAAANVRWFTETDVSIADDRELLDDIRESGCAQLLIGFESLSEGSLRETDSRGWKARRRATYLEAIRTIQSHGISVNGCFVTGFDDDGPEVFRAIDEFVEESGLTEVQVTVLTPFPGTRLYRRLFDEGRLLRQRFWEQCTLFDVTYKPAKMSPDELRDGFRNLVASLYDPVRSERRKIMRTSVLRHGRT